MEAMILAAGLGTRLRPLTNEIPKALVDVGGIPMLEHVARRLIEAGAHRLIINVHHHAEKVIDFVEAKKGFGVDVRISHERERALETGGGLKFAEAHFQKKEPFIIHNADVFTGIDLKALYRAHLEAGPLATLAVHAAGASRFLVFDENGDLCGYGDRAGNEHILRQPTGAANRADFCGIQVVAPAIFELMTESGVFSIIDTYLRLSKQGEEVQPYDIDGALWIDIGRPERLQEARELFG